MRVTSRPLTRPISPPTTTPPTTPRAVGKPSLVTSRAQSTPVTALEEPTERSMPPAMIRKVMPTATISSRATCRSRLENERLASEALMHAPWPSLAVALPIAGSAAWTASDTGAKVVDLTTLAAVAGSMQLHHPSSLLQVLLP